MTNNKFNIMKARYNYSVIGTKDFVPKENINQQLKGISNTHTVYNRLKRFNYDRKEINDFTTRWIKELKLELILTSR